MRAATQSGRSRIDRRARRRQETIDEILDVALDVMGEEGVGGLSLTEVARRMDMQPPSLYQYFDSKLAVYDELFARGTRAQTAVVLAAVEGLEPGWGTLVTGAQAFMRWCVEHPVLTQLMYWRTVPGFEPSPEAFAPSVEALELTREALQGAVSAADLVPAAASDEGLRLLTVVMGGILSQQLANEPNTSYEQGRFTSLTRQALDMFRCYYAR